MLCERRHTRKDKYCANGLIYKITGIGKVTEAQKLPENRGWDNDYLMNTEFLFRVMKII